MSKIFLSHATEEHDLVVHLANYIEKNGLEAWYAPRNIMGGIDYDREIIAAIRDCRAFVLILSHNSDASEDVKTEVYHAVKFKKVVICLDVEDIEPENLSYLLGMRHRLNWLERRDETLDKLVHDIKMIPDPDSRKITKPTVETKPMAETKPIIEANPTAETNTTIETKPTAELKPTIEAKPTAETKPTAEAKPTTETKPAADTKPTAETKPNAEAKPKKAAEVILEKRALKQKQQVEAKPKAETEAVLQKLRQKRKSEPNQKSQVPASEPETEHWIKAKRLYGIIFFAVIAVLAVLSVSHYNPLNDNPAQTEMNQTETDNIKSKENARIIYLAGKGTPEEIREAAKAGANFSINTSDVFFVPEGDIMTTLFLAVNTNTAEAVKALIDTGVDVNATANFDSGFTALMQASGKGKYDTVKVLIDGGADVNLQIKEGDFKGLTALMVAAACNQPEIVKLLLNHGVDKNIRNVDGKTAYDFAVDYSSHHEDFDSSILTLLQ